MPAVTARVRLAAVYVGLVIAAGAALIGLTALLVGSRILIRIRIGQGERDPEGNQAEASALADQLHGEALREFLSQSLLALALVSVLAALVGWFVASRLLRPIRAISRTARRVSAGDLHERVPVAGPADELTALSGTVNAMLDRIQDGIAEQDRLLERHRLFIGHAAHELRTPMATMRTAIDVTLDGDPDRQELRAMAHDVSTAVDTSRRTLDGLLALARSQSGELRDEPVDLASLAAEVIDEAREEAHRNGIELISDLRSTPIRGDGPLLRRMIGNLVDNAIRYNRPSGRISIMTDHHDGSAYLRVINTGPMITADELANLIKPFVRGSARPADEHRGAGLGLSIIDAIATAHRGTVHLTAPPSGGLEVTITLPPERVEGGRDGIWCQPFNRADVANAP